MTGVVAGAIAVKSATAHPLVTLGVAAAAGAGGYVWVRRKTRQARARRDQQWSAQWQMDRSSTWQWPSR
jgi:Flp pilus assembly protein TadB